MASRLGDRRVATSASSKPVAARVKRRLKQRLEHLPHGLHHPPVDHVGDTEATPAAARLGNLDPADHARPIGPRQQIGLQLRADDRPLLAQLVDRHAARSRSTPVRGHLQHCRGQSPRHLLDHRHRRARLRVDDRRRHTRPTRPGMKPGGRAGGPRRDVCCRDRQAQLQRLFIDRTRLPLPAGARTSGLSGHYPAFQYYAGLRFLLGHQPSSCSFSGLPNDLGTQQTSRGKTLRFRADRVANTPPGPTTETGLRCRRPACPPDDALRRFTCVRNHHASTASSRPALTEARQPIRAPANRPVDSGPRPCLIDVGFPLSGPQDRTSTSDLNVMLGTPLRARPSGPPKG